MLQYKIKRELFRVTLTCVCSSSMAMQIVTRVSYLPYLFPSLGTWNVSNIFEKVYLMRYRYAGKVHRYFCVVNSNFWKMFYESLPIMIHDPTENHDSTPKSGNVLVIRKKSKIVYQSMVLWFSANHDPSENHDSTRRRTSYNFVKKQLAVISRVQIITNGF